MEETYPNHVIDLAEWRPVRRCEAVYDYGVEPDSCRSLVIWQDRGRYPCGHAPLALLLDPESSEQELAGFFMHKIL